MKNKKFISMVLVLAMIFSMTGGLQSVQAETPKKISALTAGSLVTFGDLSWIVLNPATGYLLLNGIYKEGTFISTFQYDSVESGGEMYDPSRATNIAHRLNNNFLNSLDVAERELILNKTWTIECELSGNPGSTYCKIGLISHNEAKAYKSILESHLLGAEWWTRTKYSDGNSVILKSSGEHSGAVSVTYSNKVRPAIYLSPDSPVSENGTVLGGKNNLPVITGIDKASGTEAGGTRLVITGSYFTGAEAVYFGAEEGTNMVVNSDTSIEVTSPAGTGTVSITVKNPSGISEGNSSCQFEYIPKQETPLFSPAAGIINYDTELTITSTGAEHIYYTTDGTNPATSVGGSTFEYDDNSKPVMKENMTIKAIAVSTGKLESDIVTAAYEVDKCNVIEWIEPTSPNINGTDINKTVYYATDSITVNVKVNDIASWKLYSDVACTTEIADKIMSLNVGNNVAYVKVTASDNTTKTYVLNVNRKPSYYTVSFDKNGGDADADPTTKTAVPDGNIGTLPAEPTRVDYIFNGWNTSQDGNGTAFTENTAVTTDVTVFAQWKRIHDVTIGTMSGGSITSNPLNCTSGESVKLQILPLPGYQLKDGTLKYTFNGTDYAIDETTLSFNMPDGNISITAEFEETDYGFEPSTGAITKYYGSGGKVVIPSTIKGVQVTAIEASAFYQDFNVTSVEIPEGVTSIGIGAFQYCVNLTSVKLPTTLNSIGNNAFFSTNAIENIIIPASVTSIGNCAFAGDDSAFPSGETNMTRAFFLGDAPTMGTNVFKLAAANFTVYYPAGNNTYGDTPQWNGYTKKSYNPDPNVSYTVTYDANGTTEGSVPVPIGNLKVADSVIVSGNTGSLAKDGCRFIGWNTKADGTGDYYSEGEVLIVTGENITLYANFKAIYSINIATLTYGSISANKASAIEGEEIILEIMPDLGYEADMETLKIIDANNNEITVHYGKSNEALKKNAKSDSRVKGFYMPSTNVSVTVDFNKILYTVVFDKNGGNSEATPSTKAVVTGGKVETLPAAPTKSGYTFKGWNTAANGSGTAFTETTTVTATITVYAQWSVISNNGGGSSPSGGSNTGSNVTPTPIPTPTVTPSITPTVMPTEASKKGNTKASVTSTMTAESENDINGKAVAAVTESQMTEAVNDAVRMSVEKGNNTVAKVEIKVTAPDDSKLVETRLPKQAINEIADNKIGGLTVSTPIAAITFDEKALSVISDESVEDVNISVAKVDATDLSDEVNKIVGHRPVYNFSVTSGTDTISKFGGNVTVALPYKPKEGEDTSAIVIYYINAEGKPEIVRNCAYDDATGTITFNTNHFSQYAVGYNKVTFTDVSENEWYSKAISFIAARSIVEGTGDGNFSPEDQLTRGQFIVMAMKAYGIEPDETSEDNFADAGNTYYTGYLAKAKKLGISDGVGNNLYAPEKEITRQEMFTLLFNTLKLMGELPEGTNEIELNTFNDSDLIASWAEEAMAVFVEAGIISGDGGKVSPTNTATRAQMAQILYKMLSK